MHKVRQRMKLTIDTPGYPFFEIEAEFCEHTEQARYPDLVKCTAFACVYNDMQDEVQHGVHWCGHCDGWHTQHPTIGHKDPTELWDVECRDF